MQISNVARPVGYIKFASINQGTNPLAPRLVGVGIDEKTASWFSGYLVVILGSVTIDGWVIIAILALMAIASWVVMADKTAYVNRIKKANAVFTAEFRHVAYDLTALDAPIAPKADTAGASAAHKAMEKSPLYHVYHTGAEEIALRFKGRDAEQAKILSAQSIAAIRSALDASLVREVQQLNKSMVLLTIAIAGGPFLGLLGTVIGVMITFASIAAAGDVNVNAIAPGISAALVATVAGLVVAIPALFGYNYLTSRIRDCISDMQVFVDEFVTKMAEYYSPSIVETPQASQAARPRSSAMQLQPDANKPYDDINITPMLDLAYVLLIIFIIMTTAAVQGMKVNLPHASAQASLAKPETQAITITSDGRIFLNTVPVNMAELQDRLVTQEAQTPDFPVVVSGDGAAQYQGVMNVLDLLGRLNITQVGLATKPSGSGQ